MTPLPIVERWLRTRSFDTSSFPADRIAVERDATVSLCLVAGSRTDLGPVAATLEGLLDQGVADELLVLDVDRGTRASGDGVTPAATLLAELGPVLGRGDALWRSLSVLTGDVVAFLDGDAGGFGEHVACGLIGPLVCEPDVGYVMGSAGPSGDNGVAELTVRPLLRRFWPELTGFHDPLGREFAASRALLERVPFATGSGVEAALLLDAYASVGLRDLAQVDLGARPRPPLSLGESRQQADEVTQAVARRLDGRGLVADPEALGIVERPPMASERPAATT